MAYSTISKPSLYFNTKLYSGNGSTQSITGVGFQPDWVWLKQRANDVSNRNHMLFDSVRGTQKALSSNTTGAEDSSTSYLTSYDSDGFTVGASSVLNRNTTTYSSWNWLGANGTASNTDGSITSTVSANTTAGFSIVSYTGTGSNATIGHGLGVAPNVVITKNNTPMENGLMARAAAGAIETMPLIRVTNLSRSIEYLKKNNFFVIGLEKYGKENISDCVGNRQTALVLGSENLGLRRLTKEKLSTSAKIPIAVQTESLNVSNAAAIALYVIQNN